MDSISYCFYCSIESIVLNHLVVWFFFPIKIIITFKFHISIFYIANEKLKFLSVICFVETKIFVVSEGENISYGKNAEIIPNLSLYLKFINRGSVHNHNDVRKICFEKLLYKMLNKN